MSIKLREGQHLGSNYAITVRFRRGSPTPLSKTSKPIKPSTSFIDGWGKA